MKKAFKGSITRTTGKPLMTRRIIPKTAGWILE